MHRVVAMLAALVLAGDAAALALIWGDELPSGGSAAVPTSRPVVTSAPPAPVLFRDEFSSATVFREGEEDSNAVTIDGKYRLRIKRRHDRYFWVTERAPEYAKIQETPNLSVAVEVQNTTGEPDNWFGVFCRSMGLDTDLYRAAVRPDGSWTISRTTLGSTNYVSHVLVSGTTPGLVGFQPAAFLFRIRLDCVGAGPTALHLYVNDREVGLATDPAGLGAGNVGMVGSSATGELVYDNFVVSEIR